MVSTMECTSSGPLDTTSADSPARSSTVNVSRQVKLALSVSSSRTTRS